MIDLCAGQPEKVEFQLCTIIIHRGPRTDPAEPVAEAATAAAEETWLSHFLFEILLYTPLA